MRLAIVLPKVDVASAGTRIRYARLQAAFEDLGHTLTLNTLDDLIADPALTDDAYLISKIRDVRSVVLAHRLRAAGKHVGIDIFDDYYSHVDDSRFVHVRTWFDQIAPLLTFALTSTARMEMRLERLLPGLPRHRLNDPFTPWDHDSVAKRCAAAAQEARHSRTLRVLWFGIGNNPHFSVGLSDLCNYGHVLRELERAPWRVELTVLTNRRALTADILTRLARIGVATRIEIWSEAREAELLGATTLAFLPVNAQRFSTTKSLNRAVTALTAGAQVLSVGFPLYADLDPFLYRDGDAFLADLEADRLRLREATLPGRDAALAECGKASTEAAALATFFAALPEPAPLADGPFAVVFGRGVKPDVVAAVARGGGLTVATSLAPGKLAYDVRVRDKDVVLSAAAAAALRPILSDAPRLLDDNSGRSTLALTALGLPVLRRIPATGPHAFALYRAEVTRVRAVLAELFEPSTTFILSEQKSPFWAGKTGLDDLHLKGAA